MKTPPNVVKFRLAGFPVDKLDQKALQELRALADGYGMTVEETISTAIDQFVAGCVAEQEVEKNIIPFPRPHPPRFHREDARAQAGIQRTVRG
jgi:hypothetical protein